MTVPISPGSPRAVHAKWFARELRKAMTARGASAKRLGPAAGVAISAVGMWRAGQNLPLPSTAARVAEVLDWPRLLTIATDARTKRCPRCDGSYVDVTGAGNRAFCSPECRLIDAQLRKPTAALALHEAVRAAADARLAGAPERDTLPSILEALSSYETSNRRHRDRVDAQARRLQSITAAVDVMCRACEPEGLCRTPECPLRSFSPLQEASPRSVVTIREPEGPWGPNNRDAQLEAIRAGNAERWSRPGERERFSEESRARHAALTPEQRAELGRRISQGRRAAGPVPA